MKGISRILGPKNQKESKNSLPKPFMGDKLWSRLRRLSDQVEALTAQVSTLRRDYNRLNSKYYREDGKSPSEFTQATKDPFADYFNSLLEV